MIPQSVRSVLLAALVAGGACVAAPAPDLVDTLTDSARLAELERTIPVVMDSGDVPGLSVAIVADTGIVWARGFGVRNVETSAAVDENSVFEAASLSKPVFAYAVLELVDQGLLALDTPLARYFSYPDIAHDPRHSQITARMVLTHTTGFPNWRPGGGQLTIGFEPGSEFSYSGEGFGYLQRAVMQLTGQPLQEMMERLVFTPLGMINSSYVWDDRFEANLAMPHDGEGNVARKGRPGSGRGHAAATLHTTAPDFARFMVAVMNGSLLSDSLATAMLTSQVVVDSGVTWGLGIGLQENEAGHAFWHWGDNTNYKAYAIAYPDRRVGVVWFANSDHGQDILASMLAHTVGGTHPAATWLDYEQYDAPGRVVRAALTERYENSGIEAAIGLYRELKASEPPEAFGENLLNGLGYRLLQSESVTDAIAVFRLNIEEYPDAWNPYDSLGEAYMVAGQLDSAVVYYEKSLELNPDNVGGRAMLERIRAQMD